MPIAGRSSKYRNTLFPSLFLVIVFSQEYTRGDDYMISMFYMYFYFIKFVILNFATLMTKSIVSESLKIVAWFCQLSDGEIQRMMICPKHHHELGDY